MAAIIDLRSGATVTIFKVIYLPHLGWQNFVHFVHDRFPHWKRFRTLKMCFFSLTEHVDLFSKPLSFTFWISISEKDTSAAFIFRTKLAYLWKNQLLFPWWINSSIGLVGKKRSKMRPWAAAHASFPFHSSSVARIRHLLFTFFSGRHNHVRIWRRLLIRNRYQRQEIWRIGIIKIVLMEESTLKMRKCWDLEKL